MSEGRRITATHPDYKELNDLAEAIAVATNPQAHYLGEEEKIDDNTKTRRQWMDLDEPERLALIQILKEKMQEKLQGGRFADWINQSPIFNEE